MKLTELSEVDDTVEALLQKEPKGVHLKISNSCAQLKPFLNYYFKHDYYCFVFDALLLRTNHIYLSAGDEWMSNPTWKKTAERMLTAEAKKVG